MSPRTTKEQAHTAGPRAGKGAVDPEGKFIGSGGKTSNRVLASFDGDGDGPDDQDIANARLIAAAPDHALICWAMCIAAGRWEPFGDGRGEFCINGMRYSTNLDEFGCPVVNATIRAAIVRATGAAK